MAKFGLRICFALLSAYLFAVTAINTHADSRDQASKLADAGNDVAKRPAAADTETLAKANALVASHLPELKAVLNRLRSDQPQEYDRAMRDLAKSARRLETAKKRDERLYDIEVELLQARMQANLLTAKLKVRDSEKHRKQLREAAVRLQRAEIARVDYDIQALRTRLQRNQRQLDAAMKRLEKKQHDPDGELLRSYNAMLRKAGRAPKKDAN